ncbi:MAG: potassium channel family protein [Thermoguttaceae bacterium]
MAETKHFVVIGLGTFGMAIARRLAENHCRVTGLDAQRERVESMKDQLYEAIIADARDRDALAHLPLAAANAVIIGLGEDITQSILATLHVKELGARRIIAKGVTEEHSRILKALGVDRVVFPEAEIAKELADRLTWPNILDYLPIDPEYSLAEVVAPDSLTGKTLAQLNLRAELGILVVGVKDAMSGKLHMLPDGQYQLQPDQILLVLGKQANLDRLRDRR